MKKQHPVFSRLTGTEVSLLQTELLRRAALGFEQTERWREAAECRIELGEQDCAGALYARGDAPAQAANAWLHAGRYHEALEAYQIWEKHILPENTLDHLRALLGQSACHFLGANVRSQSLSEGSGRQAYQRARALLTGMEEQKSFIAAQCWEALGEYGMLLGRYDLIQEGYEYALEEIEAEGEDQWIRIYRAYLAQTQKHTDRLLSQDLEERLAARSLPKKREKPVILPFPVDTLQLLRTLTGHTNGVWRVAISPDGQILVSASADKNIKIWDLSTGRMLRTLTGHENTVTDVAISPDGQILVSASTDKNIRIWDLSTGRMLRTLTGHLDGVQGIAISSNGQTLVSASMDRTLKIWNFPLGGEVRMLTGHANVVRAVKISSDGQTLVSASYDQNIKVWDLASGQERHTLTGHRNLVMGVAISPDGRTLVSASADKTMKVWDLLSGREVRTFTGHENTVTDVAISPDGQTLVSVSHDKTIKIWDLPTGRMLRTLTGHTHGFQGVAISPDGQILVSASRNKTIMVWKHEGT